MAKSQIKDEPIKIKCLKCGKMKIPSITNFYTNVHPLFSSEKMEICKDCVLEYLGDKSSSGYMNRVFMVLSILDRPFISSKWINCGEDWGKYATQISSLPQNKNLRYVDSDFNKKIDYKENVKDVLENFTEEETDYTKEELKQLSRFWGTGVELEDLEFLQSEYQKFIDAYECDSYAMEILFQEAAQQRLAIKKLRQENKSVDKELKTLQDLLGSANIKPAQESGANSAEQATFGTLIKKYENERPIPEPDPIWKDVDGIKKYINIWFLGHFSKMVGVKNEHSDEYDAEMNKFKVVPPEFEGELDNLYIEELGETT